MDAAINVFVEARQQIVAAVVLETLNSVSLRTQPLL
jgi:hypothetical protein